MKYLNQSARTPGAPVKRARVVDLAGVLAAMPIEPWERQLARGLTPPMVQVLQSLRAGRPFDRGLRRGLARLALGALHQRGLVARWGDPPRVPLAPVLNAEGLIALRVLARDARTKRRAS